MSSTVRSDPLDGRRVPVEARAGDARDEELSLVGEASREVRESGVGPDGRRFPRPCGPAGVPPSGRRQGRRPSTGRRPRRQGLTASQTLTAYRGGRVPDSRSTLTGAPVLGLHTTPPGWRGCGTLRFSFRAFISCPFYGTFDFCSQRLRSLSWPTTGPQDVVRMSSRPRGPKHRTGTILNLSVPTTKSGKSGGSRKEQS